MQEVIAQVLSYGLGVWRHRWLALGVAWVIAIGGWVFVWQMPESFVATARITADTNSILGPLLRGLTISPNTDQRIAMMSRTLLSRPNLEKLASMTDLDLQVVTEAQKEALISSLEDSIKLSGSRSNRSLYSVKVIHQDRETARRIVQSLITVFIETSMRDKRQDSSGAQSFLEQQIAESEKRLIEAEARLALFKQQNVDVLPGESGYYNRLQSARGELQRAKLELREVENRRRELQRQLDGESPAIMAGGAASGIASPFNERLQALRSERDMLLVRYTEKHPEIVQLNALIAELEADLEAEYDLMRATGSSSMVGGLASSPIYQGMRSMLAETEAQAAQLRVRVEEYQRRVEELGSMLNLIPEVEARLKQLDRDYGVIAEQHRQLLKRRESARLSGDVESNSGDISFRVIDPPFVPLKPSEPNKLLLNTGVLLAAIVGGGGVALLLALVYPIVTDARMLAQVTGLPLLGAVSWNKTADEKIADRWRLAGFGTCGVILLLTFTGVLVVPVIIA